MRLLYNRSNLCTSLTSFQHRKPEHILSIFHAKIPNRIQFPEATSSKNESTASIIGYRRSPHCWGQAHPMKALCICMNLPCCNPAITAERKNKGTNTRTHRLGLPGCQGRSQQNAHKLIPCDHVSFPSHFLKLPFQIWSWFWTVWEKRTSLTSLWGVGRIKMVKLCKCSLL